MIRYASCVWELPMPTTFRAYQPDQPLLLPPDLQEWVPPGHLAHHVSDVVDALDLTSFYVDLPRFGGELVAHARPAISNWTGLW